MNHWLGEVSREPLSDVREGEQTTCKMEAIILTLIAQIEAESAAMEQYYGMEKPTAVISCCV